MAATVKQVNYALVLLESAGYDTSQMSSKYKALGAMMQECSGSVEDWLRGLDHSRISAIIDQLKWGPAAASNAQLGLPPLTGRPEMIGPAEGFRAALQPDLAKLRTRLGYAVPANAFGVAQREALRRIDTETDAEWFMSRKYPNGSAISLVCLVADEIMGLNQ